MTQIRNRYGMAVALAAVLLVGTVRADALITNFDNFNSDALFGSWSTATVVSGPTAYSITATGYGSNYKYIEDATRMGAGNNYIELMATLSGPPEADGHLGPLVQLIDGDGTHYHYRWYGQTLGSHVLTRPVQSPDFVANPGGVAGLDLNNLIHMHMELDPGAFGTTDAYTVTWENLRVFVPEPNSLLLLASCAGLLAARRRR